MIYLIGGTPRSGKTTVAQKLSKKLGLSWISADTLEGLAIHFTPKGKLKQQFPKTAIRKSTKGSNDVMYSTFSTKQITDAYIKQAKSSWEVLEVLIEYLIGEDYDYIIEGHQIHPQLVSKLKKKYKNKIQTVFLTRHLTDNIVIDALKNKSKNDWFIVKTKDKEVYPIIAKMIARYGEYFENEAKKYDYASFNMDKGFSSQITKVIKYLKS